MAAMKALLRSLLPWFLLAAVPFGGFASATMLFCGPVHGSPLPVMSSTPALSAPMAHAEGHCAEGDVPPVQDTGHDKGHEQAHAKCASATACCAGAPLAPALPATPSLPAGRDAIVPFVPAALAAVHLAGLERPPKSPGA